MYRGIKTLMRQPLINLENDILIMIHKIINKSKNIGKLKIIKVIIRLITLNYLHFLN
jgi:hypothetical protein